MIYDFCSSCGAYPIWNYTNDCLGRDYECLAIVSCLSSLSLVANLVDYMNMHGYSPASNLLGEPRKGYIGAHSVVYFPSVRTK